MADNVLRSDLRDCVQAVVTPASVRYRLAKQRAESHHWAFELTLEEYEAIGNRPCALCGFDGGPVSVDRINSDEGYTKENCQPACRVCNTIKSAFPQQEFLAHVERIHQHTHPPAFDAAA